jgi:hypothetical protein
MRVQFAASAPGFWPVLDEVNMIEHARPLCLVSCLLVVQTAVAQGPGKELAKPPALLPAPPPRDLPERVEYAFHEPLTKQPMLRLFGARARSMMTETAQGLRFTVER